MKTTHPKSMTRRRAVGFTLIELLGVLAIVALLGAIVIASVLKQLKQGQRDAESASLDGLAEAFTNSIKGTYTIQSSTNWVSALSAQLSQAPNLVGTNQWNNARVIWMDPTMQLGATTNAPTFPFVQGIAGSAVQPSNVRFLIISSLTDPMPSLSGLVFSNVWDTAVNTKPTGWPTNWIGENEDLQIRRVALHGLFYRLVLNNLDTTNAGTWTLSSVSTNTTLAAGGRREQWVLDGTTVSLTDLSGTPSIRDTLHADASYVYEGGKWLRHLSQGTGASGTSGPFGALIDAFLALPPRAGSAENKDSYVESVFNFMREFSFWGRDGAFSKSGIWTGPSQHLNDFRNENQNRMNQFQ